MKTTLGILGIILLIAAALVQFGYLKEWFEDQDKIDLFNALRSGDEPVDREAPAFDKFLDAFPPPDGTTAGSVSGIDTRARMAQDTQLLNATFAYVVDGKLTQSVCELAELRSWATKDNAGWWSLGLMIAVIGLSVVSLLLKLLRSPSN